MGWALEHLSAERRRAIAEECIRRAGGRVVRYDARSGELWAHCPWHHDDNASLSYSVTKDAWHCFGGCGGGDLISLYAEAHGLSNREAFREFQDRYGSEPRPRRDRRSSGRSGGERGKSAPKVIPDGDYQALPELPEQWLQRLEDRRGWSREVIQRLGLRLCPAGTRHHVREDRVAIPVRDEQGRLVNLRLYRPGASEGKVVSWGRGFGAARLWPPPQDWGPGPLWICEGEADTLCALSHGINACTQTGGAGTWKPGFSAAFRGREVVICYDHDQAGRDGAAKVALALSRAGATVRIVEWPDEMGDGEDLTDWLVTHGRSVDELLALARPYDSPAPLEVEVVDEGPGRFWSSGDDGRRSFRPALLAREILAEAELVTDRETLTTYRWTGTHYQAVTTQDLQAVALRKLGDLATTARASDAVNQVVALSLLPEGERMNVRPELLCLPNGMLDLDTAEVLPHAREYRATYRFPWECDPRHPQDCPEWKRYAYSAFAGPDCIRELQEMMGYCLWPDNRYEVALFVIGPSGTGKSTLLNVIQSLVGEENVANVDLADLEDQFLRAALLNKALNVFDEADTKSFTSKYFNAITTGGRLQAAYKFQQAFEFRPRCKLVFAANRFPRTASYPEALFDRLIVLRMANRVRGTDQQDPDLARKLREEMPGIFAWALVGLYNLRRRNRVLRSRATLAVLSEYRTDINPLEAFADEHLTTDPDQSTMGELWVPKEALYKRYLEWCEKNGIKRTMLKPTLLRRLYEMTHRFPEIDGRGQKETIGGVRTPVVRGVALRRESLAGSTTWGG